VDVTEDLLDRMVRAVEKVRDRLRRATRALEDAGIRYAVIGGNAVAAHVARVDEFLGRVKAQPTLGGRCSWRPLRVSCSSKPSQSGARAGSRRI
jgi:hypothetical protein